MQWVAYAPNGQFICIVEAGNEQLAGQSVQRAIGFIGPVNLEPMTYEEEAKQDVQVEGAQEEQGA